MVFSLDAGQKLAVRVARRLFNCPLLDAIRDCRAGSQVNYSSVRTPRGGGSEV
jgi:uncharacterized protein YqjF (DUF2071 family)